MSRYIQKIVLLLLLFISQFTYSQIYPVQAVPVVLSPYSSKLSDYSNPMVNRINLQLITTDLLVTNRPALLFVKIQGNGITAQSAPVLSGINPVYLNGGEILSLTSADIAGYFRFQNLQGLTTTRYSDPLPDGVYTICFQVYDLMTKKWLSQNSCATVYLMLNDPPQLNLPSNNEQIPSTDFPNIVFSWTPRHLNATNVSYEFELKEILNTSLEPAFAFEVSPLLLKEENLRTSTLLYDVSKPTLIPGKTYAWRVKAVSTNGLAENAVFKNNGYSQVFSFKYTANCSAPRFLLSEQQSRSGVKLIWQGENSHKKYHIQYRKANVENAEWFEVHTINTQTLLQGLEAGFTYEFRVGASCEMEQYGTPQSFVYSGIQTFTINKEENATSYNCGIVPKIEITNQQPLGAMVVHETFMAGDFPVKVLDVTGSNGIFSGSGYIQVPYLFDTRIGVEFNNVRINSDYQLVDGVVETTYDPDWSNVDFIDDLWDVNQQSETVDFPINSADDITVSPGGDIVVTGPDGQTETFPGGKDTVITDSTGKSYYVDAEGNVSGPNQQADGGKPTPENTDGVDKNGEVTALTAEGIKVTFEKITNETQYAFDLVTYGKELTKDYKKVDGLFVPFKAVPNGLTDKLLAKVTLSGTDVVADSLFFKTQNGVKIDAVKEGEHFVLTLKGAQKFAIEEVQATIKQGDKYKIAGVFNLVHVSPRTVKLKLVPTSSSINVADKIDEIKAVYNQLAINVQVDVLEPFDISGYLEGGKLPTENEFGDLSTYSTAQKAIINDFTKQRNPEQAYYIFVTNAASSTGQDGYMALGNQFGFVFNQSAKTIAHEFGHGALRLEHPFKQYKNKGLNKGDTQSIMDYAGGTEFLFIDWKQVNDPKFRLYAFQGQSEGEIVLKDDEYLGFSPNGKIIKTGPTNYFYRNNNSYFITGFSDGQSNGSKYEWIPESEIYLNKTTGKKFDPGNKQITGKVAIWQKSSRPDCFSLYKFIQVTNYTKANFQQIKDTIDRDNGKNWNPDSIHNPSTDCGKEAEKIKNEGIIPPKVGSEGDNGNGDVNSPEYVKNQLKGLKDKFGVNVEFSKNGKVYRQNGNGEVEEVENPLTADEINNGQWNDSDEEKVRLTNDEKGIIQIEAFGINDKNFTVASGKTADLDVVSNNIRQKTNAFYKEYGVKDLNSTPAQIGKNLNQGQENNTFADGDKIAMNNNASFGQIMSEGYTAVKVLLKDAKVEDKIYLDNKKNDVALHAPGLVTGTVEAGVTVVTDITSIGVMVYDLSTDKKVRQEAYNGFVKLKDEIGEDPKKMVPIFIDVVSESVTGITPEQWQKLNNENSDQGERGHLGSRAVVTSVKTVIAGSAFISKLPKITDDVVAKVKKVKKVFGNLEEVIAKLDWDDATKALLKSDLENNKVLKDFFENATEAEQTAFAKSWKALDNAKHTDLRKSKEAISKLGELSMHGKIADLKIDINDLAKISGVSGKSYTDVLDNISKVVDNLDAKNIQVEKFDDLIKSLGRDQHSFRDGANWTLEYLGKNLDDFAGKKLRFEDVNVSDAGRRYVDIADISNDSKKVFYEFKSVKDVPPGEFNQQFLKDLQNANDLDQIKWIFDRSKNPVGMNGKSFNEAMEEAINKLKLDRDLARKLLKETDNPTVKDLKNHLKENLDNLFLIK